MINEGIGYNKGNLGRDWESKEVTSQGSLKTIWTNALAVKVGPEQTVWVDLTVWPEDDGSDAEGQEYAANSGKGSNVIIRGK